MNRSLLILTLLLLHSLAHAQTVVENPTTVVGVDAVTTPSTDVCKEGDESEDCKTTTETKLEEKPVVSHPVLKTVSSLDLKDANLSLDLTGEKIQITGLLPAECAEKLTLSDVKRYGPAKSSENIDDVALEKKDDLKEYAATATIQITFLSDEKTPTLRDCVAKASSPSIDLSTDLRFSRTISLNPEILIAGILGEPMDLKSAEYLKLEKQIKNLDCKDCNSDWKSMRSNLMAANDPLLKSMVTKLFDAALADIDCKIDDAKNLADLEKIKAQLLDMAEFASKSEQRNTALAHFQKIVDKTAAFANGPEHKTASMATKYVESTRDTYLKMSKVPGLSDEQRAELKTQANELAPGQSKRRELLSSVDGDHPEIRDYLRTVDQDQKALQMQIQRTCMGRMAQFNFTQCGELYRQWQANQQSISGLQSRYTQAYNENQNAMFAHWDQRHIAYDRNLFTATPIPGAQYSTQSTAQYPVQLPQMYNPSTHYVDVNSGQLYQLGTVRSEQNPLYSTDVNGNLPAYYKP